jgi:CheY-like chemotaxis protein
VTSVDDRDKGIALGADAYYVKPLDRRWLLEELNARTTNRREKILVVDDDEAARYLFRQLLADTRFAFLEASTGHAGIDLVRSERPAAIILDLAMPGMSGETVMRTLKGDPATAAIPIVIATSTALSEEELTRLLADAAVVISKSEMSGQSARHLLHEALAAAGAGAR